MLEKTEGWIVRFLLGGAMLMLLLSLAFSSEVSYGAPEDPFSTYADPYAFILPAAETETTAALAETTSSLNGWQLVNEQSFPVNDLGAWESSDVSPYSDDQWGTAVIASGNWGAWVRGANVSADLSSSTVYTYTPNMDTWLIYGPIDHSDKIWNLKLAFDYFISLGTGDAFIAGYSTDGTNFEGLRVESLKMNPEMWAGAELNWQVSRAADQLWVAFGFTSNGDDDVAQGVWLDRLLLQANYGSTINLPLVANNYATELEIQGFYDDFSDPASGWRDRLYEHGDGVDLMRVGYVDEVYRMKVLLNYDGRNNRMMGLTRAPYSEEHSRYDLQVRHSFVEGDDQVTMPEFGKASLIFGANATFSTLYAFEWNYEGNCAVNKYSNVDYPITWYEGSDLDTHTIMAWRNCATFQLDGGYDADNHMRVEVRDNKATIYVMDGGNKVEVKSFTDDALRNHRRVGLVTGTWDYTPVNSHFDDFWIKPVE